VAAFTATARSIVQQLDPSLPLYRVRTMESALAESMRTRAVYSWMLAVFAGLALVLALGGTYGVTSYLVTQRAFGLLAAVGLARQLGDMLFGVPPHDPIIHAIAAALLAVAAVIANWLPARRAARTDPMVSLRI